MTKEWTKSHEKLYSMLYNYYKTIKDIDEFTFIEDNKRYLKSIIETNKKWSQSSKESLFFMVARYLEKFDNKNEKYIKIYKQAGYDLKKLKSNQENDNKQDEKEIENYRSHEYFLNILNNIKHEDIKTKIGHYQYLLLNLLVLQPTLRTHFYTSAKFLRKITENDNKSNYIWINKKGKLHVSYIVNDDKVTKTKKYSMDKKLNIIEIEDEKLSKLINDSYEKYPRTYLFEINDKPISNVTFLSWLRKITQVNNINNDIMRSSYINWFYENNKSLASKEKLSEQMRHSVMTAQKNYYKIIDDNKEDNKIEIKKENKKELINEIDDLKTKLDNCENENKISDKVYNKRRRDVIYKANKQGFIIKENTLKKYNIQYDETLQKYK